MTNKQLSPALFAACHAALSGHYPALFGAVKVPLKIGIHRDIHEQFPDQSTTLLRRFLMAWCDDPAYWESCQTEGAPRHGVHGIEGAVSAREAGYAQARLERHAKQARAA